MTEIIQNLVLKPAVAVLVRINNSDLISLIVGFKVLNDIKFYPVDTSPPLLLLL